MKYKGKDCFLAVYDNDNDTPLGVYDGTEDFAEKYGLDTKKIRRRLTANIRKNKKMSFRLEKVKGSKVYYYCYLYEDTPNDDLSDLVF